MLIESSSWCQYSVSHHLCIAVFSVLNQHLHMWLKLAGKIIEKLIISSLSLEILVSVFCFICFLSILKHYYFISLDIKIKCFLWRVGYYISAKSFCLCVLKRYFGSGTAPSSGMVLMEVGLLSGFSVSPDFVPLDNTVKKAEKDNGKVNLYLDSVSWK